MITHWHDDKKALFDVNSFYLFHKCALKTFNYSNSNFFFLENYTHENL